MAVVFRPVPGCVFSTETSACRKMINGGSGIHDYLLKQIITQISKKQLIDVKKRFTIRFFFYAVYIISGYIYSYLSSSIDRREDAGLFFGVGEAPAH